jgi:acyl carrier protein
MTTTFEGLRDIIVRDFELPPEGLRRDTALEEIELDSLAVTELVFALEDEFHVMAGNVNPSFKNLGDIADYIDQLVAERDAAPKAANGPAPKLARSARAKSAPGVLAKSASATHASGSKTSRSASNGTKAGARKHAATNGARRANGRKPRAASAAPTDTHPRKRKRSGATANGARPR